MSRRFSPGVRANVPEPTSPDEAVLRAFESDRNKFKAQLADARATLVFVRQTVHQAHHEEGEPAQCGKGVCREIAKALGE